jgi:RimK family alpha-L-glutamate ligase
MRLAIVANTVTPNNRRLLEAARAFGLDALLLAPDIAERTLGAGDVALGRIDVLPTLDDPEPGLETLQALEERGVLVLNRPGALFAVHDKLATANRLAAHGLPHPHTAHAGAASQNGFAFPVVVKPRFGSWGYDVMLCVDRRELAECLAELADRLWFQSTGALVQELVPPLGYDLRVLVANGTVVGSIQRVAAPGEWRTNVALGGTRNAVVPGMTLSRPLMLFQMATLSAISGVRSASVNSIAADCLASGAAAPFTSFSTDAAGTITSYDAVFGVCENAADIGVAAASNCVSGPIPTISSIERSIDIVL